MSLPAMPSPDKDGEQATLEVVIPADWKNGVKLATVLENGQRVIITPPDGAKPGMSREFNLTFNLSPDPDPDPSPSPSPSLNPNPNSDLNPYPAHSHFPFPLTTDPEPDLNTGQVCPSSSTCPPPRPRDFPPPLKPPRRRSRRLRRHPRHLLYLLLRRPRWSRRRHLRGRMLWWSEGRSRSVWSPYTPPDLTSTLTPHNHPTLPLPLPLTLYPTQVAAQALMSTVKVPVSYSKSALSEIYAQKTEAPWMKRASSDKYSVRHGRAARCRAAPPRRRSAPPRRHAAALPRCPATPPHCPAPPYGSYGSTPPLHCCHTRPGQMEAVRSKVPVRGASTVTGPDHAEVAERV